MLYGKVNFLQSHTERMTWIERLELIQTEIILESTKRLHQSIIPRVERATGLAVKITKAFKRFVQPHGMYPRGKKKPIVTARNPLTFSYFDCR